MTAAQAVAWQPICEQRDLVPGGGVCALLGQEQIALFYLPGHEQEIYAIGNFDPLGQASVLSRGIIGSIGERLVVASPLYKQHFDLVNGQCLEESDTSVPVYEVRLEGDRVLMRV